MTRYEVEQKFPVATFDPVLHRLKQLGAALGTPQIQSDRYFAHPMRDFARSDEALRIRSEGSHAFVTYKGPRRDEAVKTRREIEVPLLEGEPSAAELSELLEALGFRQVAQVRKRRQPVEIAWQNWQICGALDQLDRLGLFVELELSVDESQLEEAQAAITSLADLLGLSGGERRSYLEMLLAQAEPQPRPPVTLPRAEPAGG